jgi:Mrp family chromosome partitioning ATPase/capsular polysaccharide biosynthesis protein
LTVAITAMGLALSPTYVARTKLTLLPTRSELGFAAIRPEMWGMSPAALLGKTHEETMLSRTLAEDVARTLQAENAVDLNNGGAMGHVRRWLVAPVVGSFHRAVTLLNTGRWETPDPFMSLVDVIRGRTRVQNLPGSFVFQVSVTWENPEIAAKIANLTTERYVQMALAAIEAERTGLTSRQAAVEKVIGEHIAKLDKLPAKEAGLLDLYRVRMSKERALTALQDRLLETKVAEAAQLGAVRVIDTAIPPVYPERPLLLRNAATSVFVGLLLSLGFVLLAEARRAGLRSREDLGAESVHLLGLVPYVDAAGPDDPDSEKGGKSAEFFRSIAHGRHGTVAHRRMVKRHLEHLLLRLADGENARISMFVSLNGGEGKSFLIEQLARLAKDAGRKVLLIDANLNRPALHRTFGKPLTAGLAEVLSGKATASDLVASIAENVDLLCAGAVRINGQARWELSACKKQLNSLAAEYDLVLMDSASLRQDPAVARLLMLCDRTVCVFDATSSARDDLDAVREYLRGSASAVGFILNKVLYRADHLFAAGLPQNREPEASNTLAVGLASH